MASSVGKKMAGWRDEPIPWGMVLRGFLPRWLGGESVYLAVVRTHHFSTTELLADYLLRQHLIASARLEVNHADAILDILKSLRQKTSA
jgi:hypothetical protein